MEVECTLIQLNNTFSTINLEEARQLWVKPIGPKWVCKTKQNPDDTKLYKVCLVIKIFEKMDFGETYVPVGLLTTIQYPIGWVWKHGWKIDHFDVVTAFLNPEVADIDMYMTLRKGWLESLNAPGIVGRLKKAVSGLKQALWLWHNDCNSFLLPLLFAQSLADPNGYHSGDGFLMLLYIDDISMLKLENATKVVLKVKARLSAKYQITHLGMARQFLGIEVHRRDNGLGTGTGIGLGQMVFITTMLK